MIVTAILILLFIIGMIITIVWLHHRFPGCFGIMFAGGLGYFLTQILLPMPLLPLIEFQTNDNMPILILGGVISAIMSSIVCYFIVRWTLSDRLSWGGALSAGIGHGFCEALFLFVFFYMTEIMVTQLGDDSGELIAELLQHQSLINLFIDFITQLTAICFHISIYLMLVNGFLKKRALKYFIAVCGLQTIYTFMKYYRMLAEPSNWMITAATLLIGVLSCIYMLQTYQSMAKRNQLEIGKDEGEIALEEGY